MSAFALANLLLLSQDDQGDFEQGSECHQSDQPHSILDVVLVLP